MRSINFLLTYLLTYYSACRFWRRASIVMPQQPMACVVLSHSFTKFRHYGRNGSGEGVKLRRIERRHHGRLDSIETACRGVTPSSVARRLSAFRIGLPSPPLRQEISRHRSQVLLITSRNWPCASLLLQLWRRRLETLLSRHIGFILASRHATQPQATDELVDRLTYCILPPCCILCVLRFHWRRFRSSHFEPC